MYYAKDHRTAASVKLLWIFASGNISSFKRDLNVSKEPTANYRTSRINMILPRGKIPASSI